MNVPRALRSRPFTAGAIAAAILIGLVIAAALAPPTMVNIAGEGTLVVGIERPTRPAITGGRASSIVDGWYAAPLHRPIISHWNAPVGPTGNWAELRFEPPRPITGTTLFWGVGEVAPRSFDVRADFGEGYEAVAGYRGLGAEAVPIVLPARPVHGLRVDIHEGYSETDTAHWAEWLVFEQQPAPGVLLLEVVAPLVQRLLVALAFLALILVPGFTIARRLPGRLTRNASFVVGIPIALGLLGGLSALVLWRGWPAWPTLIILGAIAAYGVGHPSTRRDLARVDRRMLAIAAAGALLHVLVWHLFDTIAPKHGGDTLYPLEVARVFMTQTPFDTPDLRHTLFGYPVGFRTPLLSLLVAPFLGAFGNDVTTYLTLIYAASGLFYIPAYGVMRQHVGRAAAELGGVFLVFNAALLQWTEQVPNKLLSQSLILVALYIAAFGPNRRPFARHVSVGAVLALAYLTHNSALLGFAAVAAFEILRARAFRRGLARVIATAIPIMAVALVWAVWQGATGDAHDAFGRELAGASADVEAGGNPLSMALQRLRSIPLAEHISERLYGLASIFVWDPQGNLPEQTALSGTLQTLIPRVGVVVFVLALLNYRRVPSRARLALLTLTIVPALLTVLAFSRAGPVSPFIAFAFAYVAAFAGAAAWRTGQVRHLGSNLSWHQLVVAVVAIEFLLQILALYGDGQIANGAYGWPSSIAPILAAAGVLALGLRSIAAWAGCRAASQT